jgi:hypothetical protein
MNSQQETADMNAMIVNDMSRFIIVELPAPATHAEREALAERIAAVLAHEPKPEASKEPSITDAKLRFEAPYRAWLRGDITLDLMCNNADAACVLIAEIERLQRERDDLYRANVDLATRLAHERSAELSVDAAHDVQLLRDIADSIELEDFDSFAIELRSIARALELWRPVSPPSIPATITSEPACGGAAVNIVRAVLGDAP